MQVSLIATVLNEGTSIRRLMDSILAQTRPPDEVVICDGGSCDDTVAILREYEDRLPLKVIERPGANISQGRNAAIAVASYPVIAVTDAGVRLDPHWLEHLIAPFEADPHTHAVAGFFLPDPATPFEVAMGATVLPSLEDINPRKFMPSSRSAAFRRDVLEQVGGYPEWLDFCEDLILDFRVVAQYGPFVFAPQAIAYFRPRSSLRAFIKQYYQYARGDGKARLFFLRHLIRYLTYLAALPAIVIAAFALNPLWLLLLVAGGVYMVATPYRRLLEQWNGLNAGEKVSAALWVPVIRVVGDLAKMAGYPVGVLWRWRHRPPPGLPKPLPRLRRLNNWLERLDKTLSARLNIAEKKGAGRMMTILVTRSGDALPFLAALGALAVIGGPLWQVRAMLLVVADMLTFLIAQTLKFITRRARPEGTWGEVYRRLDPYSFPSGHAARGGAVGGMALALGPLWFGVALIAWGAAVAASRVMMGVHYLSDVIAGFLLGVSIAAVLALLVLM